MAGPGVTIGNVEVVSLLDTPREFDAAMFFPNNDSSDLDTYKERYPDA